MSANLIRQTLLKLLPKLAEEQHPPKNVHSDKYAIILDPRYDPIMEAVIRNFMHFMEPRGWQFIIISAHQYNQQITQQFPHAIVHNIDASLITQDSQGQPNITIQTYNDLLTGTSLWTDAIPPEGEHIAIFQKDCIMYRMFDDEWWLKWAFSGAFWHTRETSLQNGVINGGFSLRKRSAMLQCIQHVTWPMIETYRQNTHATQPHQPVVLKNEDVFFTYACEILRYPLAPIETRKQLAIEGEWYYGTCVFHGWDKDVYQTEEKARRLLQLSSLFGPILLENDPPQFTVAKLDLAGAYRPVIPDRVKSDPEVMVDLE